MATLTEPFQSTLPAWGATCPRGMGGNRAVYFNPRSPHGERLVTYRATYAQDLFQSTLPAWGATIRFFACGEYGDISIHAPRMGSDTTPSDEI